MLIRRLGGPPCSYVGHPLIEKRDLLRPGPGERADLGGGAARAAGPAREPAFRIAAPGRTLRRCAGAFSRWAFAGKFRVTLPAVPHLVQEITAQTRDWPVVPQIVAGEEGKFAAFRKAHLALAASGTVTLELALAGSRWWWPTRSPVWKSN